MTCGAHRLLFDYYCEKPQKPCGARLLRFSHKMPQICAIPTKPLYHNGFRLDGLRTPTLKAAGSNPVGRTTKNGKHRRMPAVFPFAPTGGPDPRLPHIGSLQGRDSWHMIGTNRRYGADTVSITDSDRRNTAAWNRKTGRQSRERPCPTRATWSGSGRCTTPCA